MHIQKNLQSLSPPPPAKVHRMCLTHAGMLLAVVTLRGSADDIPAPCWDKLYQNNYVTSLVGQ